MKSRKMNTEESVQFRTQFWGVCCESGKKYSQVVQKKFHVTKAVLESPVKGTSDIVSLMVERGDCQYLLCHLKPGILLQADLNLYFDKGEKISFLIKGHGKIHLSGYHIYGKNDILECSDLSNSTSSIQKTNVKKNKIEKCNFKSTNQDSSEEDSSEEEEFSKKSAKKDFSTVAASAKKAFPGNKKNAKMNKNDEESDDDDPFEALEESSEDESEEELKKKDAKKSQVNKRLWSSVTQDDENEESDESDSSDDDDEDTSKGKAKSFQDTKKMKKDSPAISIMKNTPNVQKKLTKVISLDDDSSALNSSIGRTPMPKKKKSLNASEANLSSQKSTPQKMNFASPGAEQSVSDSDKTVPLSESKKKKKKKKSIDGMNTSNVTEKETPKSGKGGLSSASYGQKLSGGLEYEDVRIGNGPVAKKGRLVHVHYTGMLENNKVFDSCEGSARPFSFKLGSQQVITGWELGIEGMKVGGKRRLKIPPHLGYKNQKMGPIPPNSTLYFNVELKAVS